MKWWEKELQSCRTGCWGQTQVGELTHGSTGLSPCPSPSACRYPTPTGSPLQCNPCIGRPHHAPHTSLPPVHLPFTPTPHPCPHFGYAPKASLHLPGPSPHLPARLPCTMSQRCTPRSPLLALAPSVLADSPRPPFSSFAPIPLPPYTFPPTPPPTREPPPPHPRQRLPQRHALQARLTCAATPVPALVRLLQLEGDGGPERLQTSPGGAGRDWRRAAPPEPPGPSATRPPGTSASAACCGPRHRPPAGPLARLGPTASPTQPPTPAAAAYLPYGAATGPLSPEPSLAYGSPDPSSQPIRGLIFLYQRMIG